MTQLSLKIIQCPKCGVENRIVYYASINTFMDLDGSLITKLLDGTLNTTKCKNCGVNIRLSLDVLISCPDGMFSLNPADDLEYKKKQLRSHGLLSEKGEIISGLESQFLKAKHKLNKSQESRSSPLPPPAPKVTPHTKSYNELFKKLDKMLSKNKKSDEDKESKSNTEKPKPPPPPPPQENN
jgi:hypothetical protein